MVILGVAIGKWKKLDIAPLTDFIIYLAFPCLIITNLDSQHFSGIDILLVMGGNLFILVFVGIAAHIYKKIDSQASPALYLSSMFANAGNIPFPLALFAFGEQGLSYQLVYMVTNATILYSLGIKLAVRDRRSTTEFLKIPLIYSVILALTLSYFHLQLPMVIARPISMIGKTAIPLLLFTLGIQIGRISPRKLKRALPIVLLRIPGGLVAGLLFVLIIDPPLPVKRAVLLGCAMPSAVQTFLLASKYKSDPDTAASAVIIGSIAAIFYIPVLLYLLVSIG